MTFSLSNNFINYTLIKVNYKLRITKFITLTVCCLLSVFSCYSQSIHELEEKLKTASADDKAGLLNQLSESYLQSSVNKSIDYAEQALSLSKTSGDINEEATADVNLGNAYSQNGNSAKSINYYKDAIKIFDKYNLPSNSAYIWNKIADAYNHTEKYSDAFDADTKALELFKKTNDKKGMTSMNIELGDIAFQQKKYENSLPYYQQALKISEDAKGQITILSRISRSYNGWGNYNEAYKFLSSALDIAKKNNLTSLENSLSQSIEKVKQNLTGSQKSKTDYEKEKEKQTLEQIKVKESEIHTLSTEKIKSMEEIGKLSEEAQLKELKIKTQQEEIIRKKLETEKQTQINELLKKEQELTTAELNQQRWIIWGGIAFSILLIALTFFVFRAYRNKKKANSILTQKNEIIYNQKKQIEQKSILITDSIDYAKNIQDAILPPVTSIARYFPESFVFYKPKDVVSGDFYWMYEEAGNDHFYIAAADCTGHGVPGAFMSLLGFIMLNDIARNIHVTPAEILNEVNTQLMTVLHQHSENTTGKFGMDIALIKYNKQKKEITYAGAHNSLLLINNGQMNEVKADKISIGTTTSSSFTNHTVQAKEGDMIYLCTDGYQDQIGGEKRKKFLTFHMKELLVQIHSMPMEKQKEELDRKHMEWRSKTDQTDDILIIGLKV